MLKAKEFSGLIRRSRELQLTSTVKLNKYIAKYREAGGEI